LAVRSQNEIIGALFFRKELASTRAAGPFAEAPVPPGPTTWFASSVRFIFTVHFYQSRRQLYMEVIDFNRRNSCHRRPRVLARRCCLEQVRFAIIFMSTGT
jgi:hypothetical protein